MIPFFRTCLWLLLIGLLVSCASKNQIYKDILLNEQAKVESDYEELQSHIKKGHLRRANLIQSLARQAKQKFPDWSQTLSKLEAEGGPRSSILLALRERMESTRNKIAYATDSEELAEELHKEIWAIGQGLRRDYYDLMLEDVVQVLLAMLEPDFDGSRLDDLQAVNRLVGNPHYGEWREREKNDWYWYWHEYLDAFEQLWDIHRRYQDWALHRPQSSYHDHGRAFYTSSSDLIQQDLIEASTRQLFSSTGQTFQGPYEGQSWSAGQSGNIRIPKRFGASKMTAQYDSPFKAIHSKSGSGNATYSSRNSGSFSFGGK
mgnify:FL=1